MIIILHRNSLAMIAAILQDKNLSILCTYALVCFYCLQGSNAWHANLRGRERERELAPRARHVWLQVHFGSQAMNFRVSVLPQTWI